MTLNGVTTADARYLCGSCQSPRTSHFSLQCRSPQRIVRSNEFARRPTTTTVSMYSKKESSRSAETGARGADRPSPQWYGQRCIAFPPCSPLCPCVATEINCTIRPRPCGLRQRDALRIENHVRTSSRILSLPASEQSRCKKMLLTERRNGCAVIDSEYSIFREWFRKTFYTKYFNGSQCRIYNISSTDVACNGIAIIMELSGLLASCLIYARALLEYVIFIMWLRSVIKMLPSVKFAEDNVLTFLILREKC